MARYYHPDEFRELQDRGARHGLRPRRVRPARPQLLSRARNGRRLRRRPLDADARRTRSRRRRASPPAGPARVRGRRETAVRSLAARRATSSLGDRRSTAASNPSAAAAQRPAAPRHRRRELSIRSRASCRSRRIRRPIHGVSSPIVSGLDPIAARGTRVRPRGSRAARGRGWRTASVRRRPSRPAIERVAPETARGWSQPYRDPLHRAGSPANGINGSH